MSPTDLVRFLAAIVESADDAVIGKSLDGRITSWNGGAERLYGYSAEEAIGQSVAMLVPPGREHEVTGLIDSISRGEHIKHFETIRRRKDGREIDVSLTVSPVRDEQGEVIGASTIARDVSERRAAETKFRQLLDLAPDAIVGIGVNGRIEMTNAQVEQIFGYAQDELIGQPLEVLVPERFRRAHRGHRTSYFHDPRIRAMGEGLELYARRKDGTEFPCEISLSHIQTEEGAMGVAAVRDVTERKRAAEETERLKSEFFALVSHELRTPLTSIRGYTDMLSEREGAALSPKGLEFMDVIRRNADRLDRLVQDLLLVTQVEAGSFSVELRDVNIAELAANCKSAVEPTAAEAGVTLECDADEIPPFPADASRLEQVLGNLAENAIKFTPPGGKVSARIYEDAGNCVMEIADTGVGIEPDELEHLFDRFYRADSANRDQVKGVGLGLSIVQAIVESHGGTIDVASKPGAGTTFWVTLPMRQPAREPVPEAP
jgi:PAS domain S-box-containing protein